MDFMHSYTSFMFVWKGKDMPYQSYIDSLDEGLYPKYRIILFKWSWREHNIFLWLWRQGLELIYAISKLGSKHTRILLYYNFSQVESVHQISKLESKLTMLVLLYENFKVYHLYLLITWIPDPIQDQGNRLRKFWIEQ